MANADTLNPRAGEGFESAAERAGRAIPPAWPLTTAVAVNPCFGQAGDTLAKTAARLARVSGTPVAMPRTWYKAKLEAGDITDADIEAALAVQPSDDWSLDVASVKAAANETRVKPTALPTIADLAAEASDINWPGLIEDRIGAWASGYFDSGQSLWAAPKSDPAYETWRAAAIHDVTPEIAGLKGFATTVSRTPRTGAETLAQASADLSLDAVAAETYFHTLLIGLGGWAQYARHLSWQAELSGGTDQTLRDLLVIRLVWEQALFERHKDEIASRWGEVRAAHAAPLTASRDDVIDAVLQEAVERAAQRGLVGTIEAPNPTTTETRPKLQATFCIDVRSEIFRRALEGVDPEIETLGFAGFFGLAAAHRGFGSDIVEARLPVLLTPQVETRSGGRVDEDDDFRARIAARARRAWGRFKLAAVSSFAFVEAAGPLYVGKLIRDSLGLEEKDAPNEPRPRLDPEIDDAAALDAAETILRAMSLTENFARVVVLAGHGATVTNNPHASALQCGACGGYSGEVNARLLASLLNKESIREGLKTRGITIPDDTIFIGALHDTTTDNVKLYDRDYHAPDHTADLDATRRFLDAAGRITRGERVKRLPNANNANEILRRSRDWAEVRPEWALVGCQAFIAAPRHRTSGRSLAGRAFLHDYEWRADGEKGFKVLELIMTAPVVVASWISLQYYGSSVAPDVFGAGNKLLHNVTGGIGVVEGNGGRLRVGLPWQSVHDGETLMHEPLRLAVFIEAPTEAMTDIIARHQLVRDLFDNRWLHLLAIDDTGKVHARYAGDLKWEAVDASLEAAA